MSWMIDNLRKEPKDCEQYRNLLTEQVTEIPKTCLLFTVGDAHTVELICQKYPETLFAVFDYEALVKFLNFADIPNIKYTFAIKKEWDSQGEFLRVVEEEIDKAGKHLQSILNQGVTQ